MKGAEEKPRERQSRRGEGRRERRSRGRGSGGGGRRQEEKKESGDRRMSRSQESGGQEEEGGGRRKTADQSKSKKKRLVGTSGRSDTIIVIAVSGRGRAIGNHRAASSDSDGVHQRARRLVEGDGRLVRRHRDLRETTIAID